MSIWDILGIEPTDDKKLIKSAYREKLREVNPESHPEEFMSLREAYEKALSGQSINERIEESEGCDSPLEKWTSDLQELYENSMRRFQVSEWEKLFHSEICESLDTREDAGIIFLEFFSEYPHISRDVLLKAEEVFHFTENEEELESIFGSDYIQYVLKIRMKEKEYPEHKFFAADIVADADYDAYIEDFYALDAACDEEDSSRVKLLIEKLDATGIRHPAVEVKRLFLCKDKKEDIEHIFDKIEEIWGEYDEAVYVKGEYLFSNRQAEEAEKYFKRALELNPDHEQATILLAFSLRAQERIVEARNLILNTDNPKLQMEMSEFVRELDEEIIWEYGAKLLLDAITEDEVYNLAVSYLRKGNPDEAQKTIDMLAEKDAWEIKYKRVSVLVLEGQGRFEEALPEVESLITVLEQNEETKENQRYLSDAYMSLGKIKLHLRKKKEALEALDKAVILSDTKENALMQEAVILMGFRFYELAADVFSKLADEKPRNVMYRYNRGVCYYHAGALQEAHADFQYICTADNSAWNAHFYCAKIYLQTQDWQSADEMFQFFNERGIDTDTTRLLHGIYLEYTKEYEKAQEVFEKIIEEYDSEKSDLEHIGEVYLHLVQTGISLDKFEFRLLGKLKKAIKAEPEYLPLWEKRWEINESLGDEEAAQKDIREILKLSPYHKAANEKMVELCEDSGKMKKAREHLETQEEVSAEFYLNKAVHEINSGEYSEAWVSINQAERLGAEETGIYAARGLYYVATGEDERAISEYENYHKECEGTLFYEEIGKAYCRLGDHDKAREMCRLLIEKGDKIDGYELLYEIELKTKHYEEARNAVKLWNSARGKTPLNYLYNVKVGRIHLHKQQYFKAFFWLVETEIFVSEGNELLGCLSLYRGHSKSALKYFKNGIKEWPDYIALYYYAAIASLVLEKKDKAQEYAAEGLKRIQSCERIGLQLKRYYKWNGAFYSLLGEFDKAKECFNRALEAPVCVDCIVCQCQETYLQMAVMYHLMGDEKKRDEAFSYADKEGMNDINFKCLQKLIEERKF